MREFGKAGQFYYDIVRGIDHRSVQPDRVRKSVGVEETFERDLYLIEDLGKELLLIAAELWKRYRKTGATGRTLTLKIKFADFEQHTRSKTSPSGFGSETEISGQGAELLRSAFPYPKGIRLLGLSVSNFQQENKLPLQLTLDF